MHSSGRADVARPRSRRPAAHAAPRARSFGLPLVSTAPARHGRLVPAPLTALLVGASGGGLALLGVLGPAGAATTGTAVAAQAPAAPAALDIAPRDGGERASRSRRAATPAPEPAPVAADVAPVPAPPRPEPAAPVLPGCDGQAHDISGHANGRLPKAVLCELPGGSGERLRADAAVSFVGLAAAYQAAFGEPICLTDGYRPLVEQQQLRRTKPRLAARPGYSEHGWGLAVDLSCGVQSFNSDRHAWMVAHAGRYGWFLPEWAQRTGARPEPWHWEFSGS